MKVIWPSLQNVWVGSDAETALACIGKDSDIKLIVIAGTGSNCHAKDSNSVSKVGGFGHVLGMNAYKVYLKVNSFSHLKT